MEKIVTETINFTCYLKKNFGFYILVKAYWQDQRRSAESFK